MSSFVIEGGHTLQGEITPQGSAVSGDILVDDILAVAGDRCGIDEGHHFLEVGMRGARVESQVVGLVGVFTANL